jgi:hypothetical protein
VGSRMSEEQKNDLKIKIQIGIFLAVILGALYAVGPGIHKFLDHARKNKDKKWAPEWYLRVAKVLHSTFREKESLKVCEEFYLVWSGDESKLPLAETLEAYYGERYDKQMHHWIWPAVAQQYVGKNAPKRPPWQGGEGAKPHPLLTDIMVMVIKHHEGERDYPPLRHIIRASLAAFPKETVAYKRLEEAQKRDIVRSY